MPVTEPKTPATEPALSWGIAFAIVTAVLEAVRSVQETGHVGPWSIVFVGLPIVLTALVRANVVSAETVRTILTRARDAERAVEALSDRLDIAPQDRLAGRPPSS